MVGCQQPEHVPAQTLADSILAHVLWMRVYIYIYICVRIDMIQSSYKSLVLKSKRRLVTDRVLGPVLGLIPCELASNSSAS